MLQWLVLSPHYRVVRLLPFVLIGVVLARTGLGRKGAVGMMGLGVVAGAAFVTLRWTGLMGSGAPSGSTMDVLMDLALTGCAFGALVLFARLPAMAGVLTGLGSVRAVGAMALTAYVLHVVLIALVRLSVDPTAVAEHWPMPVAGILLATVLACWAWWRSLGRGPVERLMSRVTDRIG